MKSFDELLADFSAQQLTSRGQSRASVTAYARDLRQYAELSVEAGSGLLTRRSVLDWLAALAGLELSSRSRARKLSALRSFVRWAIEYGHISEDPIPRELTSPRSLYLPHALSEREVASLLARCSGEDPRSLRDRAILETLYATAMRVSELAGLSMLDLQLAEGFALVTGKGSKQRIVPLGHYATEALQRYLAGARSEICPRAAAQGEVFLTRRGAMSRSTVFRIVQRYAELAGLAGRVSPHTFRHSCASHMLARGADLRLVQELLGHSALSTTQVYTHIERSRMRSAYELSHPLG